MLKQSMCVAVMALACVAMAGCSSSGGAASKSQSDVLAVAPVSIVSRTAGSDAALKDTGVYLVNDAAALEKFGSDELAKIEVDFASQSLIILAQGEQSSGGYWVHINGVQTLGDIIYVQGVANIPGQGATTQALTHPYEAVVVAKVKGTIVPDIAQVVGQEHPAD